MFLVSNVAHFFVQSITANTAYLLKLILQSLLFCWCIWMLRVTRTAIKYCLLVSLCKKINKWSFSPGYSFSNKSNPYPSSHLVALIWCVWYFSDKSNFATWTNFPFQKKTMESNTCFLENWFLAYNTLTAFIMNWSPEMKQRYSKCHLLGVDHGSSSGVNGKKASPDHLHLDHLVC